MRHLDMVKRRASMTRRAISRTLSDVGKVNPETPEKNLIHALPTHSGSAWRGLTHYFLMVAITKKTSAVPGGSVDLNKGPTVPFLGRGGARHM